MFIRSWRYHLMETNTFFIHFIKLRVFLTASVNESVPSRPLLLDSDRVFSLCCVDLISDAEMVFLCEGVLLWFQRPHWLHVCGSLWVLCVPFTRGSGFVHILLHKSCVECGAATLTRLLPSLTSYMLWFLHHSAVSPPQSACLSTSCLSSPQWESPNSRGRQIVTWGFKTERLVRRKEEWVHLQRLWSINMS